MGLSDEEGYPHEGTINFLDNTVDPSSGTILGPRGVFKNPMPYYLVPGLFVRLRVPVCKQPPSLGSPMKPSGPIRRGLICSSWERTMSSNAAK